MTNYVFINYLVRHHSQGMYKKVTYIRMRKFKIQKIKYLFISIKVQLITTSSIIPYISKTNNTSNSLKKKVRTSKERKRKRKIRRRRKAEREEERIKKNIKRDKGRGKKRKRKAKGKEKDMEKRRIRKR